MNSLTGKTLSHYEILEQLGAGGMGVVYKARDIHLRRPVALKALAPESSEDPRRRRRFLREARAASTLNHPGIVTIHDIVSHDAVDFIVMELVCGQLLSERIPEQGMDWREAVGYALQLAQAIAAAHRAGVVHRDLKPRNIMITDEGQVKVLDFGVAKLDRIIDTETITETSGNLTREGMTPGTLLYMSPEQLLGQPVDRRSDIFSFGIVLYEMLTDRLPFVGESVTALVRRLAFVDPEPFRLRSGRVPESLQHVVSKALAKIVEDRYQDMEEIVSDLRQMPVAEETIRTSMPYTFPGNSEPGRAPTTFNSPEKRQRRSLSTGKALRVSALGLLVLTLGLLNGGGHIYGGAPVFGPAATAYELCLQGQRYLDRYDRESYIEKAIERFRDAIDRSPNHALAHSGLGRAYWRKYRDRDDPVWIDRARQNARHAVGISPMLSDARVSLALVDIALGRASEARRVFEELLELDPRNADVHRGLADLEWLAGRSEGAIRHYRQAIDLEPDNWEFHLRLGDIFYKTGSYAAAEAAFLRTLELAPDSVFGRRSLGTIYQYQGRSAEAITELQRSISIRPTANAYSNLGGVYFFQGNYREAIDAYEKALDLGPGDYLLWANLGDAYRVVDGHDRAAADAYLRAIQLLREKLKLHPEDQELLSRLALYQAKRGELQPALEVVRRIEPLDERPVSTVYRAVQIFELCGERERALEALAQVLGAGHSFSVIRAEPELVRLREDVRFHRLALRYSGD